MSSKFDHRQFNLVTEQDAIDFLDLIVAKAPQLQKILKDNRLKQASLISRAEFAEGKKAEAETETLDQSTAVETSIADRLSGKVTPRTTVVAATRIQQMRQAAANRGSRAPLIPLENETTPPTTDELNAAGAAGVAALETSMVTENDDDPLNLPEAGQIGQLPIAPAPSEPVTPPADPAGGVDLAALAAAQNDEEEIAAQAGTSPSEHATDDELQQENPAGAGAPPVEPTSLVPPADLVPAGDRIAQVQSQNTQS